MGAARGSDQIDDPLSEGTVRIVATGLDVREDQGAIVVDITARGRGDVVDATGSVQLELSRARAERLLSDLQSRLVETDRVTDASGSGSESRTLDSDRPTGVPYQEMGLTREEFDAAADELAFMAPYWDRDDMDEYYDLLKR